METTRPTPMVAVIPDHTVCHLQLRIHLYSLALFSAGVVFSATRKTTESWKALIHPQSHMVPVKDIQDLKVPHCCEYVSCLHLHELKSSYHSCESGSASRPRLRRNGILLFKHSQPEWFHAEQLEGSGETGHPIGGHCSINQARMETCLHWSLCICETSDEGRYVEGASSKSFRLRVKYLFSWSDTGFHATILSWGDIPFPTFRLEPEPWNSIIVVFALGS